MVYEKASRDKIRSSFRLPPLFVGLSEDMTFATAKTAYQVAETQVFQPEREKFDNTINHAVLSTYAPKYWRFKSGQPQLSDGKEILEAIKQFDSVGALTPNIAITLANQFLGSELRTIPDEWGNFPFPMVLALIQASRLKIDTLENMKPTDIAPPPTAPDAGNGKPGGPPVKTNAGQPDKPDHPTKVTAQGKGKPSGSK